MVTSDASMVAQARARKRWKGGAESVASASPGPSTREVYCVDPGFGWSIVACTPACATTGTACTAASISERRRS